jgi:hypothetical protein
VLYAVVYVVPGATMADIAREIGSGLGIGDPGYPLTRVSTIGPDNLTTAPAIATY